MKFLIYARVQFLFISRGQDLTISSSVQRFVQHKLAKKIELLKSREIGLVLASGKLVLKKELGLDKIFCKVFIPIPEREGLLPAISLKRQTKIISAWASTDDFKK